MTKTQLIDKIAKESGLTKKQAAKAFDACMNTVVGALTEGENVQISGFGSFLVKDVPAHVGRNPRTNESVEIAASRRISFVPSKSLKEKIKG
ncbi:MAG: HU family DNA-binding protein [Ruminococcaceae bacterium]|nr:HU family DNA-binding protein [Oscillospiraceae bacterium]